MAAFEAKQLHHVNVVVGDLDAARAFYRDVLLLEEIDRPEFSNPGFWLVVGAAQIHVALGDEPAPRRHHFALEVSNFEAAVAHVEAFGVEVRRFPVVAGAGLQAAVRDPSGNMIELRQSC